MRPPPQFRLWSPDRPPRWHEHWGPQWAQRHRDWDRWDRRAAPPAAPPPIYQRAYAGHRYPNAEQQEAIRQAHDRSRPQVPPPQRPEAVPRAQGPLGLPAPVPPAPAAPPRQTREALPAEQARPQPRHAGATGEQHAQRVEPVTDRRLRHAEPTRRVPEREQPPAAQSARANEGAQAPRHGHAERQPREHRD
jgi:hypothetical protein